jgi:Protein of unknown function (DUF559)
MARHGRALRDQDGCCYLLFYEGGYVLPTLHLVSPCEKPLPLRKGGPGGVATHASELGPVFANFQVGAREYDQKRQQFIESFGIRIVRVLNTDIYENLDGVLEKIGREVLNRRGRRASRNWLRLDHPP